MSDQSLVSVLLYIFAVPFARLAVEMSIANRKLRATLFAVITIALVGVGFYWGRIADQLPTFSASVGALASDGRTWFVLLFTILIYGMVTSLMDLSNRQSILKTQLPLILRALNDYILPRTLTDQQKSAIVKHLDRYPANTFSMRVVKRNSEAEGYRRQIEALLKRAHWTAGNTDVIDESIEDVQEGLHILFVHPLNDSPKSDDPLNPLPNLLLQDALTREGVPVNNCGEVGRDVKKREVVITIGHRPRSLLDR